MCLCPQEGGTLAAAASVTPNIHPQGPSSVLPVPMKAAVMMSFQCPRGREFVCWKLQTVAGGSAGVQGKDFGGPRLAGASHSLTKPCLPSQV